MQYSRSASTSNCVNSSVIPFSQDIRTSRMHCTSSSDIQWRTIQNNKIIIPKIKLWQQYLSDNQKIKNVKTICEEYCSRSYPFANIRILSLLKNEKSDWEEIKTRTLMIEDSFFSMWIACSDLGHFYEFNLICE